MVNDPMNDPADEFADEFEVALRDRLHRRVGDVKATAPSAGGVIRRARARQHRQRAAVGALSVAGLVGSGALLWNRPVDEPLVAGSGSTPGSTNPRPAPYPDTSRTVISASDPLVARAVNNDYALMGFDEDVRRCTAEKADREIARGRLAPPNLDWSEPGAVGQALLDCAGRASVLSKLARTMARTGQPGQPLDVACLEERAAGLSDDQLAAYVGGMIDNVERILRIPAPDGAVCWTDTSR